MRKLNAELAVALERLGVGKFEVKGRTIVFSDLRDKRSAVWGCRNKQDAQFQLDAWRRHFCRIVQLD